MIWIMENWRVFLTFVLTASVAVFLHLFIGFIDEAERAEELATAKLELIHQCNAKMQVTYEVSDEYQKKISALNRRAGELKRMHDNAKCLPVTSTPSRSDATSPRGELSRQGGIRSDWFIDLGASCEDMRLRVVGLQEFIRKERE